MTLEAAVLALPHGYLERLGTPMPTVLRAVATPPMDRRQKWLDLADVIAKRVPTEASRRTIKFLISLATESHLNCGYHLFVIPKCENRHTLNPFYPLHSVTEESLDMDVSHLTPLPWLSSAMPREDVDIEAPSVLRKLCPAMYFRASLRWKI